MAASVSADIAAALRIAPIHATRSRAYINMIYSDQPIMCDNELTVKSIKVVAPVLISRYLYTV